MAQDKLFTRDFNFLMVAHFCQALGFSSMLLFPLYMDFLAASRSEIGAIMAASAVGGLVARPWIAWALDHYGRKRTLVAGTLVMGTSMWLVYGIGGVDPVAFGMRMLFGVGAGTCFSGYFAFAADLIPDSRRTEGLALFGVTGLVPLLVNPISGQIISDPSDIQWFLPAIGGVVLISLIPLLLVREPQGISGRRPWRIREVLGSLRSKPLVPVWFISFAFSGLVAIFFSFATVSATDRGTDNPTHIWYMYALGAAVVRITGAKALDRVGPANLVAPALASYIASVLVASSGTTDSDFLLAGLLAGIGHGICFPVLTSQVITRTPEHHRGSAMAMFTAIWALSGLLLPPIFGSVSDALDDHAMFLLAGFSANLFLMGWVVLEHKCAPHRADRS